jgi:hypothetical protein
MTSPSSASPNQGNERRKHPRIEKHFIINVYDIDKPGSDHCISQIKNVSRGGLCFSSSFPFDLGTRLQTMIKTPYMGQAVSIITKVVDSKEKVANVIYDIRVSIEEASPEAEEILQKIEKSFLQSQSNY